MQLDHNSIWFSKCFIKKRENCSSQLKNKCVEFYEGLHLSRKIKDWIFVHSSGFLYFGIKIFYAIRRNHSSIFAVPVAITIKGTASKRDILLFHKKGQQQQRQQRQR